MMPGRPLLAVVPLLVAVLVGACAGTAVAPEDDEATPPADTLSVGIVVLEDEIVLQGRLFGARNEPLVILSHMRPNDQTAWFDFAEELADNGYAALTFDFRGYGISDGEQDFAKLDEDLTTVVRYMRDQGREQIFLVGASMGGTTALVVAAQEDVAGVVAISAPAEFEDQDALAAVPTIDEPKLFIASEDDTAALLSLDELLAAAGQPEDSQVYTGNAHGTDLFLDISEHAAAVRQRIIGFLREHTVP